MWGSVGIAPLFLTSTSDVGVVSFTPMPLYPRGKSLRTHWIGGRVGPSISLDAVGERKILHHWEGLFDTEYKTITSLKN
jgi:hypothetical protein